MKLSITQNVVVDDAEVAKIIEAITEATESYTYNATVLGCLAAAIVMCYSDISKAKLAEGVKLMSENLALWIDDENVPTTVH